MKKKFTLLMIAFVVLTGCDNKEAPVNSTPPDSDNTLVEETAAAEDSDDVIEINEKMFIAQTNDIYYNVADYLGKTIKYEGVFEIYDVSENGENYYAVIRYGPGCCGNDANAGFEVIWDNDYPDQNEWVEATGILEEYQEAGETYLRLMLTSLTVLPTRGAEYVSQ